MLEINNTVTKKKDDFDWLNSRCNPDEETISDCDDKSSEASQTKIQRK